MLRVKCSEKGCPKYIDYEEEPVANLAEAEFELEERERAVYLTCELGHTHSYQLKV